ncbi:DNA recombination protein RmuC [Mesotoga sp.]|jgi:DNA recombination protein RmuC|uniref:DNA recombination protein RmuC n=1 Tax=Mesotoga sp. TaxID=2053577 RepID=UPI00345E2BF7
MLIALIILSTVTLVSFLFAIASIRRLSRSIKKNQELQLSLKDLERDVSDRDEKLEWLTSAKEELEATFKAISSDVLNSSTENFIRQANDKFSGLLKLQKEDWGSQKKDFESLVSPVRDNLEKLEKNVKELESKREGAYKALEEQLKMLSEANTDLRQGVTDLKSALRNRSTRGRWGEIELRRIVELSGMTEHVDFEEQESIDNGRPDMIVKLPNEAFIPVDAKVPLDSYLTALEEEDESLRKRLMGSYAKNVRDTVNRLAGKKYSEAFSRTADFVVMFVPLESAINAAFLADPDLFEYAVSKKVLIASPVNLVALLKSVAYGWQQYSLTENAERLVQASKELYERFGVFFSHYNRLQGHLKNAVRAYNDGVGSFESRLLPKVREIEALAEVNEKLREIEEISDEPRSSDLVNRD